jgi:hypothetical protein
MFANAARAAGKAADVGSRLAASARERSIAALLDEMDRAGIALGVVTGRANSVLGSIPNDDLRAIVARHPGRFVAFAGIERSPRSARRRGRDSGASRSSRAFIPIPGTSTMRACTRSMRAARSETWSCC